MTTTEDKIDPITADLRAFVEANLAELEQDLIAVRNEIVVPVAKLQHGRVAKPLAFTAFSASIKRAEMHMEKILPHQSKDFWLAYVRRLPTVLRTWPHDWITYATLSVLKWSNAKEDTTGGSAKVGNQYSVVLKHSRYDLILCCRLASIGRIISELNNATRWLAKGSHVNHLGNGVFTILSPPDVEKAVEMYEKRRPDAQLMADEALLVVSDLSSFIKFPIFTLGKPKHPMDEVVLLRTGEKIPIYFFPAPYGPTSIRQVLSPYEEALQDLFGIGSEGIISIFNAFCKLVLGSMPVPEDSHHLAFNANLGDAEFEHRLKFMIDFLRKGFVRFPIKELESSLIESIVFSGIEKKVAEETVDSFFTAFCLKATERREIDVRVLQPTYLLYTSASGQYYIDWLQMPDFLRWLIVSSREWFSSQHGDRFTLALKTLVEKNAKQAKVISWKKKYPGRAGQREVDLLVSGGGKLYVIECKAFAKSRSFWLGHPTATTSRMSRINTAAKQAMEAATTIRDALESGTSGLPEVSTVEWVLCCPAQEYIFPWNKYGFLSTDIPRVCTPEELIIHLNRDV